jgi:predicted RNA binding protein YcfA (HicA-like mRNA interferase family)
MPSIEDTVQFLIENDSLHIGESPWPSSDEDKEDIHQVDWSILFPPSNRPNSSEDGPPQNDNWAFPVTEEEIEELKEVFGTWHPLNPQSNNQISSPMHLPQWDVCAWYQPIHYFGHSWGIFIREDCVTRAAMTIARFLSPSVLLKNPNYEVWYRALYRAGVFLFFLHEHYHHKVECLGLRLHVARRKSAYLSYQSSVYRPTTGTDDQLEEALANAESYLRLGTRPYSYWLGEDVLDAVRKYLRWRFPIDPPGYRMAVSYLTKASFDPAENLLQAQVSESVLAPIQPTSEWNLAPRMTQSFFPVTSNIWSVVPAGASSRLPRSRIAPIQTCSTDDMVRLYQQAGYQVVKGGGKGSHVKLKKQGAPTMNLPGNRDNLSPTVAATAAQILGDYKLRDLRTLLSKGLR